MLRNCGEKCFLGPNKTFPICAKNTCRKSNKGLYAAYVRAKQMSDTPRRRYTRSGRRNRSLPRSKYEKIARRARRQLVTAGYKVGN